MEDIAAVLGSIAIIAGTQAPAVLIVSFIPMLFMDGAFYYTNRADPYCGTTFSWVTRAMGPWLGWMGGWAIFSTGVPTFSGWERPWRWRSSSSSWVWCSWSSRE